ncbi:GerAB/ArcD/ProY family transporter [Paenibacillus sp. S-38]|uniref:GerAB/ArcD/ProY family transporter n=1 Tax=Paenibacillus sp. S-38 TaxID=3416710 RepID=UPI003CECC1CD
MIKRSNGKIGTREYGSLILITVGMKLADTTPTLLMDQGQNAGWLLALFSFVLMLTAFVVLTSVLRRNEGKGLMELITELAGTYAGFGIGLLLAAAMLLTTVFSSRSYADIVNTMVYQKTPPNALYAMFLLAAYYISKRGFEAIGRTAWIIIPYIEVFLALLVFFVWQDIDWLHLAPAAGPGWDHLIRQSPFYTAIFGEMVLMAAFVPFVRTASEFRRASFLCFIFSSIKIVVMTAVYIAVFDYPAAKNMAYPFQQLTRTATIGQFITHVESIFLAFWLIAAVIHISVYLYMLAFIFARTFRMDEFEPLILPLAVLVLLLGLLPENNPRVSQYRDLVLHGSSLFYLCLPFLLWALDRLRRRSSNEHA